MRMSMNSDHQEVCESFGIDEDATIEQSCTENVNHQAADIDDITLECKENQPPSRTKNLMYGVDESPSPLLWPLFGLQHVISSIAGIITIPLLTCTIICADHLPEVKAQLISLSMLTCGIGTILQTVLGVRLPIIQGAAPHFLLSVASIMTVSSWTCSSQESEEKKENYTSNETWIMAVREIQGNLMLASLTQVFLGMTGLVGLLLKFIGPLTIAPTIALMGLSLAPLVSGMCETHWAISSGTVALLVIFILILGRYNVPLPVYTRINHCHIVRSFFPYLLCGLCAAFVHKLVFPSSPNHPAYKARTDTRLHVVSNAPWFYFPYPGQFGIPTISVAGYVGMLAATIASIVESVGDYFNTARASECPSPPAHAVNRGIAMEGLGCLIAGSLGAVHGITSYSDTASLVVVTKIASRPVFVTAGVILTVFGVVGKFGALASIIPVPIMGGVAMVSLGMVSAVGLSNLQCVDMSSCRNLMVLGLSMMLGLALPHWVSTHPGAIQTGTKELDHVLTLTLGSPMLVGCVVAFILDNLAPGTQAERGLVQCRGQQSNEANKEREDTSTYAPPLISRYV